MHAPPSAPVRDASDAAVLDPIADGRWGALVANAADACIFHHPSWLELLRDQYGYRMLACCVLDGADGEGAPRAGLPLALVASRLTGRRLVALPFSDVCPPVGGDDAAVAELGAAAEAL